MEDTDVVKKALRSLLDKFDSKISTIEELKDMNRYTIDDIHGALVSYEMRKEGKQESTIKEVASAIRGIGEKMEDIYIVKKLLRSLPDKFDSKIFSIEEAKDITKYTMGALVAYEMRKYGK